MSRVAGVPRAALWFSLCLLCPFHYRPSGKHAGKQGGGHRREVGKTGVGTRGRGGASSVIFNMSGGTAKKADKEKQKDRKGKDKQKQRGRGFEEGGGRGGQIRQGYFVRLGRRGGSI